MRYHVICEEEKEKTKIVRPRIDSVVEAENIDQAENIVCARFPAYKKVSAEAMMHSRQMIFWIFKCFLYIRPSPLNLHPVRGAVARPPG